MLLKELGVFLLYYFEVSAAAIYLGLALIGVKPGLKNVLTMGFLVGFIMFLVRYSYSMLNIPLGSHFIFSLLAVILVNRYIAHVTWARSVTATLISNIITILSEALLSPVFFKYFNITHEDMVSNFWLHLSGGYFGNLLIFILAFIVHVSDYSLIRPSKTENTYFGK